MTSLEIRNSFPNPVSADDTTTPSCYCVLGAAILYKRHAVPEKTVDELKFPSILIAVDELGIESQAAQVITDLNDEGNFDEAWRLLDIALQGRWPRVWYENMGCEGGGMFV